MCRAGSATAPWTAALSSKPEGSNSEHFIPRPSAFRQNGTNSNEGSILALPIIVPSGHPRSVLYLVKLILGQPQALSTTLTPGLVPAKPVPSIIGGVSIYTYRLSSFSSNVL